MRLETVRRITSHPRYQELVRKRTRFGWTLAAILLVIYFGFICVIAFAPGLLAERLSEDGVVTLGIPVGIGVIVAAFVLTGVYVSRANSEFDGLTKEIREQAR